MTASGLGFLMLMVLQAAVSPPSMPRVIAEPLLPIVYFQPGSLDVDFSAGSVETVVIPVLDDYRRCRGLSWLVAGHAGFDLPSEQALRLSELRAERVAAVVRGHVRPEQSVTAVGRGDTDPYVRVPRGARVPLNDRVIVNPVPGDDFRCSE